jgi:hypothetical protein
MACDPLRPAREVAATQSLELQGEVRRITQSVVISDNFAQSLLHDDQEKQAA